MLRFSAFEFRRVYFLYKNNEAEMEKNDQMEVEAGKFKNKNTK